MSAFPHSPPLFYNLSQFHVAAQNLIHDGGNIRVFFFGNTLDKRDNFIIEIHGRIQLCAFVEKFPRSP